MNQTPRVLRIGVGVVALAGMFGLGWIVAKAGVGQAMPLESLTELERTFAERMQEVVLVGNFTIAGRETRGGSPERYEISSVSKVGDDRWRFDVRMVYGSVDATLPVVVPIVWAGDTPVVSITDFSIPSLGTFTARVFFYEDRYGGSWQHGQYGGLMYGHIEPMDAS
ncbi:uncharacterized protein METZ01_LOCUS55756 [marine metagenome]|uniref:Uncharacterized protein n=1 Tax=marine metagenome TaxID=408172 RepID=A0A381SFP6_9ZZZZ